MFVGVLALIGGGLAYFVFDVTSNAGTQKIVLPATFKDLTKDTDNEIADAMEKEITSEFGKGDGAWNPTGVSAVYQDSSEEPQLIVVGGYGKVLLPKQELDAMFKGFSSGGPAVTDRHAVDSQAPRAAPWSAPRPPSPAPTWASAPGPTTAPWCC